MRRPIEFGCHVDGCQVIGLYVPETDDPVQAHRDAETNAALYGWVVMGRVILCPRHAAPTELEGRLALLEARNSSLVQDLADIRQEQARVTEESRSALAMQGRVLAHLMRSFASLAPWTGQPPSSGSKGGDA